MDVLPASSEIPVVTSGVNHSGFTAAETMVVPSVIQQPSVAPLPVISSSVSGPPSTMVDNIALPPTSKSVIDSTNTLAQDTIVTAGHLSSKSTPQVSQLFVYILTQ